jgi:imidazole glycerol phosphate synthase subunit HisF
MSHVFRVISKLEIKNHNLVKGVGLEGLRALGNAEKFANFYYDQNIDEIFYQDIVASLYGQNNLLELIKTTANNIFVPLTVGGGIRTINDVYKRVQNTPLDHLLNMINEEDDAETADVILQTVFYNEVVFG